MNLVSQILIITITFVLLANASPFKKPLEYLIRNMEKSNMQTERDIIIFNSDDKGKYFNIVSFFKFHNISL